MKKMVIGLVLGLMIGMTGAVYAGYYQTSVTVYTDPDTNVQYLIADYNNGDGVGVGICPRYTPNGNVMYVGSEIIEGR